MAWKVAAAPNARRRIDSSSSSSARPGPGGHIDEASAVGRRPGRGTRASESESCGNLMTGSRKRSSTKKYEIWRCASGVVDVTCRVLGFFSSQIERHPARVLPGFEGRYV